MGGVILTKTHRSPHSVKRMNFRREKNPAAHNAAYNAAHNAAHNAAEQTLPEAQRTQGIESIT